MLFAVAMLASAAANAEELANLSIAEASHDGSNPMWDYFPHGLYDGDEWSHGLVNYADETVEITFVFSDPQTVVASRAFWASAWGDPAYEWDLECADNEVDLDAQSGSYRLLASDVQTAGDIWSEVTFTEVSCRAFRWRSYRLTGDHYLHANELQLILADGPPKKDQCEGNASEWGSFASDGATHSVSDELVTVHTGSAAVRLDTASSEASGLVYPVTNDAHWDVTALPFLSFWEFAASDITFEGSQPAVILVTPSGEARYEPNEPRSPSGQWRRQLVPLAGGSGWHREDTGSPDLADVLQVRIEHDPVDAGYALVVDDLRFLDAFASGWPMRQRDMHHTGRADFEVPVSRQGEDFFDAILWQTRTPWSPSSGEIGATQMTYFDGAGPGGADLVTGTYHWPKGIQGMNRWTGEILWQGNPSGGESLASRSGVFSRDGRTVYVTNDATPGHPLMAFDSETGPSTFWHNGDNADPEALSMDTPVIGPDGRIFLHRWNSKPSSGVDRGTWIEHLWTAGTSSAILHADSSLFEAEDGLRIVTAQATNGVRVWNLDTGAELWSTATEDLRASPTIDPSNGNIYVPAGVASTYIVGLDKDGNPLWSDADLLVYEHVPGVNDAHLAEADGCLAHDGRTFYFTTTSEAGSGLLYAINTEDGSVKWTYPINGQKRPSLNRDYAVSAPIVTPNNIVIVGNNEGDTYFAIRDDDSAPTIIDTLETDPDDDPKLEAAASPMLSSDGILYIPYRGVWLEGNPGAAADLTVQNLFTAIDLRAGARPKLYPPTEQKVEARNAAVYVSWRRPVNSGGRFSHYNVYRDTQDFSGVEGLVPIDTITDIATEEYLDTTATNGTSYFYAVTTVANDSEETTDVGGVGPATPYDETDLQVVTVSRGPLYPRYAPGYETFEVTEPSGFGPYYFSSATSLQEGQTADTKRWPDVGETVTYTATIRNRGSNAWSGTLAGTFRVDGNVEATPAFSTSLAPGDTATLSFDRTWDDELHDITFTLDVADDRSGNNELYVGTKSVAFLSYVERSRISNFREQSLSVPSAITDDFIDWINAHIKRMNELFEAAGTEKRVHYDLLEVIDDGAADPVVDRINYAIFPFRYNGDEGTLRDSGYYDAAEDLDYGLLHEWAHQLGLIDLYRLNLGGHRNDVSGLGYSATPGLMNGVSHFFSEHSANAMTHWLHTAHGYYGQYLYQMPDQVRMQFLGVDGQPLAGATVKVYQKVDRPGLGEIITTQVKNQGTTDANGYYVLPNVSIDPALVPETFAGDKLNDNPFGYVAVVGNNGLLHFEIERDGFVDYAWLEIVDVNNAYWGGVTDIATFTRSTTLGGEIQTCPLEDFTELNAGSWIAQADGASSSLHDDFERFIVGSASLREETSGGFDTYVRYPGDRNAAWDLSTATHVQFWLYAENPSPYGFQEGPWVKLGRGGDYLTLKPSGAPINDARGQWQRYVVPLAGGDGWTREEFGLSALNEVQYLEIHADTWDSGFTLWHDGVGFLPHGPGEVSGLAITKGATDMLSWNSLTGALSYDVRRGDLGALTRTHFGECLVDDWLTTSYEIPGNPAPAEGYFYLVSGTGECKGSLGTLGDDTPRIDHSAQACP